MVEIRKLRSLLLLDGFELTEESTILIYKQGQRKLQTSSHKTVSEF